MIDHISVAVSDIAASKAFYEAVLAPLNMVMFVDFGDRVGFGKKYPEFWINARPGVAKVSDDTGVHICLRAPSQEAVDGFFTAALEKGGRSDGDPAIRPATITEYYGAFIRDLDGNKIEAVTFLKPAL